MKYWCFPSSEAVVVAAFRALNLWVALSATEHCVRTCMGALCAASSFSDHRTHDAVTIKTMDLTGRSCDLLLLLSQLRHNPSVAFINFYCCTVLHYSSMQTGFKRVVAVEEGVFVQKSCVGALRVPAGGVCLQLCAVLPTVNTVPAGRGVAAVSYFTHSFLSAGSFGSNHRDDLA